MTLPTVSKIPDAAQKTAPRTNSREKLDHLGFVRREPILTRDSQEIIGYELMLNHSSELLGGKASPMLNRMHDELLLKSILALEISQLIGDTLVFIHISPATLEHALILQLTGHKVVLAFRPEAENADRQIARCRELKTYGFRFSLDNFTCSPGLYPLLGIVDFIRFDIPSQNQTDLGPQLEAIPRLSEKTLIAKNVYTAESLKNATRLSFHHYQGNRLDHSTQDTEPLISRYRAEIIVLMNMLVNRAETTEIEDVLQQDSALALRILRHINSPANGLEQEAHSFSEALARFGYDTLHRWLSLLLFCQEASPCHLERSLQENALLRGRLTELFGQRKLPVEDRAGLFVSGIFSCLDTLFGMPLDKALSHFSLSPSMGQALLRRDGPYAPFLKLAIACVDHDQPSIEHHAKMTGIGIEQANTIYVKALVWTHELQQKAGH
ncbi:MAG: HDOD domain-containing protein [Sulfurimicrobium sp.]|nr:HDOD domain-containing protein [Sulfurimicrobium sp.]MDZ7656021.1 HDOD domain-containing protein [Sulfurimicrobium sp.]